MLSLRDDIFFLRRAYEEAVKSYQLDEVPIGAVLVKDNQIIGKGFNSRITEKNPLHHAEIVAIKEASRNINNWRLDNTTIYITLEPCLMCLGAILQSRIKRIVYCCKDFKGGAFSVCGDRIKDFPFNIEVDYIPLPECLYLLKKFFKEKRKRKRF